MLHWRRTCSRSRRPRAGWCSCPARSAPGPRMITRWPLPGPSLASPKLRTGSVSGAGRSRRSIPRRGCLLAATECPGELGAAGDATLAEDLAQVVFDGAGADEQPRGDLPVGQVVGDQAGDLLLLRCEHLRGPGAARAGPGGERRHAHLIEHRKRGAQLVPRVVAAALAAQPLAVAGAPGPARGGAG